MGVETDIDFASPARNPGGSFEVTVHDSRFPTVGFDADEAALLDEQMNQLIADLDSATLLEVMQQRADVIGKTAAFAKQVFDEKVFGGINAGDNEIGFSVLRPGHIDNGVNKADLNEWYFQPGAGLNDWIGNGTAGTTAGAGGSNNYLVTEDQVMVVLGFMDLEQGPSEISMINVQEFGRNMDMLPIGTTRSRLMDNENDIQFTSLPTLIAQENDNIHIRLRYDRDVERQPALFGFTYGLGSYLNTEDYS